MKVESLTKEKIVFFFNKYKYNSDLISHLERRLLKESYDFDKWKKMLTENSVLTRRLFAENEMLLNEYIRPAIKYPDQLSAEALDSFLLHIMFFLFENNIDSHVTEDLINAILKRPDLTKRRSFDAMLNLGISRTLTGLSSLEDTNKCFEAAEAIFPTYEEADDDDTRIHMAFCSIYHMLAYDLYHSNDTDGLIKIYRNTEKLIYTGSPELYAKMWGESSDKKIHIKLYLRYLRIYAIFAAGQNEFNGGREAAKTVTQWLEQEYKEEQKEGKINAMIFTYYHLHRYVSGVINKEKYYSLLYEEYNALKKNNITDYMYPEAVYPLDNDPVDPQFANMLDMTKLFCSSFSFVYILIPQIFKISDNLSFKKQLSNDIRRYYELIPYPMKGISIDRFIIKNLIMLSETFKTTEECISFLQTLFVHRQISSAIHFSMVSKIAFLCLSHFLKNKPELFVNIPGLPDIDSINKNSSEFLEYIRQAGFFHDIGKLGCNNIINLHFRRLTNSEFSIIKKHPDIGNLIIEHFPILQKYESIVLGHHKSWDGKSGYSENIDNSKSKIKILIGLITICDCIDAATDSLGRNYTHGKTFETVLEELKAAAGTRYSPELVNLIDEDEVLKSKLKFLTEKGRTAAYFETYNQYVVPNMCFTAEDEKSISIYTKKFHRQLSDFYSLCYPNSEEKIEIHLGQLLSVKNSRGYILHNKKNIIYGILYGHTVIPLSSEEKYFMIDDIIIAPEIRRKGWGTQLFLKASEALKREGITKIKMNVYNDFNTESFFWINGFSESKTNQMEKKL